MLEVQSWAALITWWKVEKQHGKKGLFLCFIWTVLCKSGWKYAWIPFFLATVKAKTLHPIQKCTTQRNRTSCHNDKLMTSKTDQTTSMDSRFRQVYGEYSFLHRIQIPSNSFLGYFDVTHHPSFLLMTIFRGHFGNNSWMTCRNLYWTYLANSFWLPYWTNMSKTGLTHALLVSIKRSSLQLPLLQQTWVLCIANN